MCQQPVLLSYAETTPDAIDDKSGQKDIVQQNLDQLVTIQVVTARDIIGNLFQRYVWF